MALLCTLLQRLGYDHSTVNIVLNVIITIIIILFRSAPCGLRGCKNRVCSVSWPEFAKDVPNQGLVCFVSWEYFSVCLLCLACMSCFVSLFLVVSTSGVDCVERPLSEMAMFCSSSIFYFCSVICPITMLVSYEC